MFYFLEGDVFGINQVNLITEEEGFGNGKGSVFFCCTIYRCNCLKPVRIRFMSIDNLGVEKSLHEVAILAVNKPHDLWVVQ